MRLEHLVALECKEVLKDLWGCVKGIKEDFIKYGTI